ncbi:transposase [[Clostridium] scindens]|uniref:transposase n=1 Tax=Clostridium scindens (strain JCM 10418 / VPI 12708) TaxID=29347 RepID=UPI002B2D7D89|nr:hypothetical protein GAFPHCNK_01294 [[Clostridium] scindens]
MQKIYSPEELNSFSRETLVAVILSMQNQLTQLNTNMERLIEQIASANNHRYGRSSEKLDVIAGQLELELIFNEAEALTETLYVVEPREEDVIQVTRRKKKGKREADLKDLPVEVIPHTIPEAKLHVFCKHFLEKNAKYFWRMLHLQIGESCKASAGSYSASYIAIADHI